MTVKASLYNCPASQCFVIGVQILLKGLRSQKKVLKVTASPLYFSMLNKNNVENSPPKGHNQFCRSCRLLKWFSQNTLTTTFPKSLFPKELRSTSKLKSTASYALSWDHWLTSDFQRRNVQGVSVTHPIKALTCIPCPDLEAQLAETESRHLH